MAWQHLEGDGFTLVACCEDAYAVQAQSLLEAVASFRDTGKGLADGVTVQLGWSVLSAGRCLWGGTFPIQTPRPSCLLLP